MNNEVLETEKQNKETTWLEDVLAPIRNQEID